jgi:hypothetical protein
MYNSTKAKSWMKKINFEKHSNDPIQATTRVNAARQYAQLFMDTDVNSLSAMMDGRDHPLLN